MLPNRVSNPGPLTYESGALPIALRGPAKTGRDIALFEAVKDAVRVDVVRWQRRCSHRYREPPYEIPQICTTRLTSVYVYLKAYMIG